MIQAHSSCKQPETGDVLQSEFEQPHVDLQEARSLQWWRAGHPAASAAWLHRQHEHLYQANNCPKCTMPVIQKQRSQMSAGVSIE